LNCRGESQVQDSDGQQGCSNTWGHLGAGLSLPVTPGTMVLIRLQKSGGQSSSRAVSGTLGCGFYRGYCTTLVAGDRGVSLSFCVMTEAAV
jgi:hypothetical protein